MCTSSTTLQLDFVLPLPYPFDNVQITCPRLEDASHIVTILNDDVVGIWMGEGLPRPHELHHAQQWLKRVKPQCDIGQEDLCRLNSLDSPLADNWQADKANNENDNDSRVQSNVVRECPVRIIRELVGGQEIYLGDIGLVKWNFLDIADKKEREQQIEKNCNKKTGDPTIIWSIGYYLKPSHQGRGIMKTAIQTLLAWAVINMNVRHIRTTAMEDNRPSLRVLQQNGFLVEKTLPHVALKAGIRVGLVVLEKKEIL